MGTAKVYIPEVVTEVQKAHRNEVFEQALQFSSILDHLTAYAETLWDELKKRASHAYIQTNNYHPEYLGKSIKSLKKVDISFRDCQLTTAKSFGFEDWNEVKDLANKAYNADFEIAINCLVRGEVESLRELLSLKPDILQMHSQYGHQARLLHYASSNGVEIWRQQVPYNLPEMIRLLQEMGADPHAGMKVYGGIYSTLELLKTSAHPYEAGVGVKAAEILETI